MKLKRFLVGLLLVALIGGAWISWEYFGRFFNPNVSLQSSSVELFIPTDATFSDVIDVLATAGYIEDMDAFVWAAKYKNYHNVVKPGRYIITDRMTNNQLVNLLRSGAQSPVDVIVRSVRTKSMLAQTVAEQLELDSAELMSLLSDPGFCARYGFNTTTIFSMFIPNTYEFYWNTDARSFVERMAAEYKRFWNEERMAKIRLLKMTQSEVATLASLVQAEQGAHPDERPKVAGLYLNRLRRGMRLQSDPTLIHAVGDFTIKRVLTEHKSIDSPYNTYMYAGLPPGPILLPAISSIDAVLSAEKHNFLYMCAKEDFSGYHHFSSNYSTHLRHARNYHRALNQRKIYR